MKHLCRNRFLAAAGAALAGAASRPAVAQTATKIRVIAVPIDVSAEPYYALEEGFFKKVGLSADVSTLGNGAQIIPALIGGQAEFGAGGTSSVALAHEKGIPIVMVAPAGSYSVAHRTHGMVVRSDSPMRVPRDIIGKTIGAAGIKTLADVCLHAWLDKNGIDANAVKQVEMPYSAQIAGLFGGRIDAADLEEPYLSAALAQGARFFANVFDAIAPEWVEGAYFCTEGYARANPDVVKKFADAIAMAADWGNHHPAEAWSELEKYTHTAPQPGAQHCLYTERLRVTDIQPLIDASAKYGLLQKSFPARDLFAPGIG